jgi:hypothetical protein
MTAKFHFIRHRPTVLDELPLDVIRVHIFPCLDYYSRINLNQCLPPWDRIQNKMDPLAIRKHDNYIRRAHINEILLKVTLLAIIHPHRNTDIAVAKNLAKVLELHFNPMYFSYIQDSEIYRNGLLIHINQILQGNPVAAPKALAITQNDLILTTQRLVKKIAESGPYGPTVNYKSVEELKFV